MNGFADSFANKEGVSGLAFLVQLQHCFQEIPLNSLHSPWEATLKTASLPSMNINMQHLRGCLHSRSLKISLSETEMEDVTLPDVAVKKAPFVFKLFAKEEKHLTVNGDVGGHPLVDMDLGLHIQDSV